MGHENKQEYRCPFTGESHEGGKESSKKEKSINQIESNKSKQNRNKKQNTKCVGDAVSDKIIFRSLILFFSYTSKKESILAQGKRVGPITQRSSDRNR